MDFEAALSFLRTEIDKSIKGRFPVPKGFLENHVKEKSGISKILEKELADRLTRHLETFYGTNQGDGHVLKTDFEEWYRQRKGEINFYFWRRLQKYWLDHSILPVQVVGSVDSVTDEIVGYLGDPHENKSWCRRGLVMGHVQSGKTTNYSALIAKAADAGYRVIIVLAGLTNSLRYQTQVRLDQSFVGKSSLGDSVASVIYPVSHVFKGIEGENPDIRHPYCGTTQASDFNVGKATGIGAAEGNFADPILFVTKKHDQVLEQLAIWLRGLRQGSQLEGPMLLIDDEADNASINTAKNPNATTKINARIRELLDCSRRSSYVGYTATPFANIFIDPDTNDEMLKNDLFPEHFIKSLEPPGNYIGADKLFSENGEFYKICVRPIPDDYQDLLPLKHKSGDLVTELPQSLKDAVFEYALFRCLRTLAGEGGRHSSMLVNVSRFNAIQQQVHDAIYRLIQEMKATVDVWAASPTWERSEVLSRLFEVWRKEYEIYSEFSWDEVRTVLKRAISSIEVRLVNMRGGGLDYDKAPDSGLHVITIGGLALSRGLTLEGLSVSYVLRNVGAADTLLQMGRWFGYRPGYEKLCRIHATTDMLGDFREVSDSVEELRDDLVRMEKMGLTPDQFGLKVRQSPTGIAITAANKMRAAKPLLIALDLSARHLQAYELFNRADINRKHLDAVASLVAKLNSEFSGKCVNDESAFVWSDISVTVVKEFLQKFKLPQLEFALGNNEERSLALDYISDRAAGELASWDIAIPFRRKGSFKFPQDLGIKGAERIFCRERHTGVPKSDDPDVVKVTEKNIVADKAPTDLKYGERGESLEAKIKQIRKEDSKIRAEKACLLARKRPLLIIHLFDFILDPARTKGKSLKFKSDLPVVTLSLAFPDTSVQPIQREYAISVRMAQLLKQQLEEAQSDEEIFDE
ncbi:Z1 domain-containing protein [Sodalis sp. RH21]|uniref:Z1 domain-containing protein n=1 Tax=unclassified Sodalis (in: enterobacteria) TaxID=2636512 RepID=UPI0039B5CA37